MHSTKRHEMLADNTVEGPDDLAFEFGLRQAVGVGPGEAAFHAAPHPVLVEGKVGEGAFGVSAPAKRDARGNILVGLRDPYRYTRRPLASRSLVSCHAMLLSGSEVPGVVPPSVSRVAA